MSKRAKPIVLLIRRVVDGRSVWLHHSDHASNHDAEVHWSQRIKGRGVTAWSWWGPRRIAEKMLADPNYDLDSESIAIPEAQRKDGEKDV